MPLYKKPRPKIKEPKIPIYDYVCVQCKRAFEYFHSNSQDKVAQCPSCGSKDEKHEKQIPKNTSHILKGKGWAKDGYG